MKDYRELVKKGQAVEAWFSIPDVQTIFNELDQDIKTLWAQSASDQEDERERLYRELHGLRALKERITKIIKDGKKAEQELEHDRREQD